MIIGICGREGAGKSTVASILACRPRIEYVRMEPSVFISQIVFGTSNASTHELIHKMMKQIDTDYENITGEKSNYLRKLPLTTYVPMFEMDTDKTLEISMADPLKQIASVIFGIDFSLLLNHCDERERTLSVYYPCFTGRTCLEYLGTNIFRRYDPDIWIKVFKRNTIGMTNDIVISDIRFANEAELVNILIAVYRHPKDLILTEADKSSHPAKWTFLTFIDRAHKVYNNSTIEELAQKIIDILNSKLIVD